MTDLAWDPVEDVREIVCLFVPVSISGRPSGVVLYDNDSRLPLTPLLRTISNAYHYIENTLSGNPVGN